jgi:hypothetical protein
MHKIQSSNVISRKINMHFVCILFRNQYLHPRKAPQPFIKPSDWWTISTRHQMYRVLQLKPKANIVLRGIVSPCFLYLLLYLTVERIKQTAIRISSDWFFLSHRNCHFPCDWFMHRTSFKLYFVRGDGRDHVPMHSCMKLSSPIQTL